MDLNGRRAAIAAGYKENSATVQASQLLTRLNIKNRVAELKQEQFEALDISAKRVLSEIAKLSFSNMDDYVVTEGDKKVLNMAGLTRDQMAAVCEITEDTTGGTGDGERKVVVRTKFKLYDKTKNLELLGRHLKLFTDVIKHEGLESLAGVLTGQE